MFGKCFLCLVSIRTVISVLSLPRVVNCTNTPELYCPVFHHPLRWRTQTDPILKGGIQIQTLKLGHRLNSVWTRQHSLLQPTSQQLDRIRRRESARHCQSELINTCDPGINADCNLSHWRQRPGVIRVFFPACSSRATRLGGSVNVSFGLSLWSVWTASSESAVRTVNSRSTRCVFVLPSCVHAPSRLMMFLCFPMIFIISISEIRSERSFSVASAGGGGELIRPGQLVCYICYKSTRSSERRLSWRTPPGERHSKVGDNKRCFPYILTPPSSLMNTWFIQDVKGPHKFLLHPPVCTVAAIQRLNSLTICCNSHIYL